MQCRTVLTRIDALRTRELATIEKIAVEQHFKTCRSCNESQADVINLAHAIKSLAVVPERSCRDAVKEEIADSFDRVGDTWVAFANGRIRMIAEAKSIDDVRAAYAKKYGRVLEPAAIPDALRRQVQAAVQGEGVNSPKVDLDATNDLEHDVLTTLSRIPRGEVRTYAWVARQAGRPRAVRAVASIIARNPVPYVVPCHRVVPSSGGVGNYIFGSATKRALLEREGVNVDELDALAREHVRYIGSRTTHIFCFPTCRDAKRIQEKNRMPFRDADDALENGYRPCRHCQPVAA
ncbi:MAG: methylated-DNA-[protein]-cysteine S-methyltransferase [Thermoanaerobaculia bacterium]|jgi:O-6-methylguanine DNA methyltransferase|nr:methylated-DNA-[protein]-cysteine S-methyltransferase [Thermoanaerobaculia bacterium]